MDTKNEAKMHRWENWVRRVLGEREVTEAQRMEDIELRAALFRMENLSGSNRGRW